MSVLHDAQEENEIAAIDQTLKQLEISQMRGRVVEQILTQREIMDCDHSAQLKEVEAAWINALEHNYLWPEHGITLSDAHFHSYCALLSGSHKKFREKMNILRLPCVLAILAIKSSRHGDKFGESFDMTCDEMDDLWAIVVPFIVDHLACGSMMMRMHLQLKIDQGETLQALQIERAIKMPLSELENDMQLNMEHCWLQLQIPYENDPDAQHKILDSEIAGYLFRTDLVHCSEALLNIASRMFGQLVIERNILNASQLLDCSGSFTLMLHNCKSFDDQVRITNIVALSVLCQS